VSDRRAGRGLAESAPPLLRAFLVFLFFLALSVFWTWPLAAHLPSRVVSDPGDPVLNAWILWWNTQAVPLTAAWWSPPIFVPMAGALALSEHLLGISLLAWPAQAAGASPLAAYNIALILSFALSAFFAWLLARRLSGSRFAALCAALAFGFAPYRAGQLSHLQVLTSQWMPLALLGLHGYVESGRRAWLVLFGGAWLMQALSNGYYMLFLPALIVPWILYFVDWRRTPQRAVTIAAAWMLASLPLVPILLKYREVHGWLGLARAPSDIRRFSATIGSFFEPPPALAVWPAGAPATQEHFLFPGVTAVVLVATACLAMVVLGRARSAKEVEAIGAAAAPRRSPFIFYVCATVVMWALALGPGPEDAGALAWLYPYRWIWWLPGFDGLRTPARFAMPAALCLAMAGALAAVRLRPSGRLSRPIFAAIVVGGLIADGLLERAPLVPPPARVLPDVPDRTLVIEIPPDDPAVSAAAMYRSIFHRLPLANGYSGHTPAHYAVLSEALRRGDPSPLTYLAGGRPLAILVDPMLDRDGGFREMVAALPGIESRGETAAGPMFVLPPQPLVRMPQAGPAIASQARALEPLRVQIELGAVQPVGSLEITVRHRYREVHRRMLIESSEDGAAWKEAWLGWTGALVLEATLANPRDVVIRIPLAGTRARYLKVYPAPNWMVEDARVLGVN
jgi:hypothetical protein